MQDTGKAGAGRRVLVIEDEFLIAQMVGDMLADLNCVCIGPITTLAAGVEAAASVHCDAAIINLIIQGQMAYAVAEELAARNIPFCFASGTSPASVHEKWRQRRFISKPYLLDDVRAFLDEVFRQQDRNG